MDLWDEERHIATCRGVTPIAERTAQEIRDALNQHDALLAELDELQAQRDALAGACEMLVEAREFEDSELLRRATKAASAALALVRGEAANG
jgi:hypothetical protein